MSKESSKIVSDVRNRSNRRAHKLEKLIHEVWQDEALLSSVAGPHDDLEAAELEADLGCVCVDHLHPALVALRKASERPRQQAPPSDDIAAPLPEALARC